MEAKDYEMASYRKMVIAGISGAYTDSPVSAVPEGFYGYGVRFPGTDAGVVLTRKLPPKGGVFICRDALNLGIWGKKRYEGKEFDLSENELNYEAFFGCRRPIDYQIQDAEQRRDQMAAGGRDKSRENELG